MAWMTQFDAGLAALAAAGLAMTPGFSASRTHDIVIPMCLGGSHPFLPPRDDDRRDHSCPGACHALCARRDDNNPED